MPLNSTFIPYTPNPFDSHHKFEREVDIDKIVAQISGREQYDNVIHRNWNEYLERNLIFPFDAMVEVPIKKKYDQSVATIQKNMKIISIAPLDRCPAPYMVLIATIDTQDEGRYVYAQDIRKIIDNEHIEKSLIYYRY